MTREYFVRQCTIAFRLAQGDSKKFMDFADKLYNDIYREKRTQQRRYQRKIKQLEDKVSDVY
jgi:hypothetical protein